MAEPPAPLEVAVGAVDLEVGPRPRVEAGLVVVGVGQAAAPRRGAAGRRSSRAARAGRSWFSPPVAGDVAVELGGVERQGRGRLAAEDGRAGLDPRVVAEHALRPGGEPVGRAPAGPPARGCRATDSVRLAPRRRPGSRRPGRRPRRRCRAASSPPRGGGPGSRAGAGVRPASPSDDVERDGPGQHRAVGELPVPARVDLDPAVAGDRQEPLGPGAVGPELGVDRVGDDAGRRACGRGSRRTGRSGSGSGGTAATAPGGRGRVGDEAIDLVGPLELEQVELARVVLAEGDEPQPGVGQRAVPGDAAGRRAAGPRPCPTGSRRRHRSPTRSVEAAAAIDIAAGDRGGLGVGMVDRRRQDRRGPAPALGADGLAALEDAPAVVAAALDAVDQLPQLPADVADPEVAGRPVEAHPPGVAQAVGPDLGPGAGELDERVVRAGRGRPGPGRGGRRRSAGSRTSRSLMSCPVSSGSGGEGAAASPVEMYRKPSGPNARQPPLWPPEGKVRTISSLAGSIRGGSTPRAANRETRVPSGRVAGQRVAEEDLAVLREPGMERQAVERPEPGPRVAARSRATSA